MRVPVRSINGLPASKELHLLYHLTFISGRGLVRTSQEVESDRPPGCVMVPSVSKLLLFSTNMQIARKVPRIRLECVVGMVGDVWESCG